MYAIDKIKAVEALAEVRQIKTMADFSVNVILNFPEQCKEQAKSFIDWQGKVVHIWVVVEE